MDLSPLIPAISVVWLSSEIILARMKHSGQSSSQHDKSSLRILWTVITLSIFAGISLGRGSLGHIRTGDIMPLLGILLIVSGLVVRWSAILTLRKYFTVDVAISNDHKMIVSGLYRYVRHPAYLGSLLSFLGLAVSFSNWLAALVVFLPITGAFIYRIRVEETALAAYLGEAYRQYCSTTKRLIPGVY